MSVGQLNAIKDPALRQLVQSLFDHVTALQTQLATLQTQALQRGGAVPVASRLQDVYDPEALTDAVNVRSMRKYVQAQVRAAAYVPPPTVAGVPGDTNSPPSVISGALPLPASAGVVSAVFAANPAFVATSCQTAPGGTWDLMDAIVDALRAGDTRWGYNGKRGNANDPSKDALAYDYGAVAGGEGSPNVYIVDVIAGHCGSNPQPAYNDVTVFAPGVWIGRGRF